MGRAELGDGVGAAPIVNDAPPANGAEVPAPNVKPDEAGWDGRPVLTAAGEAG